MMMVSKTIKRTPHDTLKYSEEDLALGFTSNFIDNVKQPVCVVCLNTLSNESMKLAKIPSTFEN